MNELFQAIPFGPADILLPKDCDLSRWSVVACDQYTSQPEYWQRVEEYVGDAPSSLRLILPEGSLELPGVEARIDQIYRTMFQYLQEDRFRTYPDALLYIERTLDCGKVRRGLVGMVDLEEYDYTPKAQVRVRATEGTVLSRIPPRAAVRWGAPVELPHAMLLVDDPERTVVEPLADQTDEMEPVYAFDLMERGGHIRGWLLNRQQKQQVALALQKLADPDRFRSQYGLNGEEEVLLFAVGDGNHSLATAKACYERAKGETPAQRWASLPARYALCELGNLHDDSLEFEPIHRVVFGVEPERLLADLDRACEAGNLSGADGAAHVLEYVRAGGRGAIRVDFPKAQLPVGTLQTFLDDYLKRHPEARVDYIHGDDVAAGLAEERADAVAFLLPPMGKDMLFPTVIHDGALPRKTFSMGEAHDKRFYLEARAIRD